MKNLIILSLALIASTANASKVCDCSLPVNKIDTSACELSARILHTLDVKPHSKVVEFEDDEHYQEVGLIRVETFDYNDTGLPIRFDSTRQFRVGKIHFASEREAVENRTLGKEFFIQARGQKILKTLSGRTGADLSSLTIDKVNTVTHSKIQLSCSPSNDLEDLREFIEGINP